MDKSEFEKLIGQAMTDEDYEVAEMAYLFHPAFRSMNVKEFAEFYQSCGRESFYYSFPAIKKYRDLVSQLQHTNEAIDQAEKELEKLRQKKNEIMKRKLEMWDDLDVLVDHAWITYHMKELGNKKGDTANKVPHERREQNAYYNR